MSSDRICRGFLSTFPRQLINLLGELDWCIKHNIISKPKVFSSKPDWYSFKITVSKFSMPFSYSTQNRIMDCSSFRSIYPPLLFNIYMLNRRPLQVNITVLMWYSRRAHEGNVVVVHMFLTCRQYLKLLGELVNERNSTGSINGFSWTNLSSTSYT